VTTWRDFQRAGWDTHVDPYHDFFGPVCAHLVDPLLDAVAAGPGIRLLDACCGPGYVAGRALERGAVVVGLDIAPAMVALAAALHPAGRFHAGDCEQLPYADGSFDAIVCNLGLHHLTDPARGVRELGRVLRSGGSLALTVWDDERSALDIVPEAIAAVGVVAPEGLPAAPDLPAYDKREELEPLLGQAGLRLGSIAPVAFVHEYVDAQFLWDGWLAAAIRTGPLLAAQSQQVQRAARERFAELVVRYAGSDGRVALPVGFLLITAVAR
jgi:SAM-dependent methyltransferase